eukprot:04174_5
MQVRLALIVLAIDLKKLRSIVGLPLFSRPEGSSLSWIGARGLAVACTGEQPWQAGGAGVYAPASMISESATDVLESTEYAYLSWRLRSCSALLDACRSVVLQPSHRPPVAGATCSVSPTRCISGRTVVVCRTGKAGLGLV